MDRFLALIAVLPIVASCAPLDARSPALGSASPEPLVSVQPSRDPGDLAQLPQEAAVLRVFEAADVTVQTVGASKFADALGALRPARVFIVTAGGRGADILFLDAAPPGVRVCASLSSLGYVRYTVSVNGQRASSVDTPEGKSLFYLVSPQFFVIAWDEATSSALQSGLGVVPAGC